jgi:hypothetical protein
MTPILVQPTYITRTQYTKRCWCSASWRWASNARNMYRPLIHNELNTKSASQCYWVPFTYVQLDLYFPKQHQWKTVCWQHVLCYCDQNHGYSHNRRTNKFY